MHGLLALALLACGAEDAPDAPAPPPAVAPAAPEAEADADAHEDGPRAAGLDDTPALDAPLVDGPTKVPPDAPPRIAARHLLVAYKGAVGADPALRRTREEALERARDARARILGGADFATVAAEISDGPSAPRGGDLGAFGQGVMHSRFEATAFRLDLGQVSNIVETPFGFHVIRRELLDEVRVAHVVVQYAGAARAEGATRTADEARARAAEARARLAAGEPVEAVVNAYSEGAFASRGGDLGFFQRGQLLPQVEDAAFALGVGDVSPVVETPSGFHVLVRLE